MLRIEDTDPARNRPEWIDKIISSLAAIGISKEDPAFEGPYFQSANSDSHKAAASSLYTSGAAYYCDCTREQLAERTGTTQTGYDGYCRDRGLDYQPGRALRFRTPDDGDTVVVDLIRGVTTFPNAALEDFVVARGDGSAVFLLANVADDIDQKITEVIRGEEHLSNTPKQQMLWCALRGSPPQWAHLPVIVNEKRQKLSKRRDKVALEDFLAEGYLPAAMVNYLTLLGWGPKEGGEIQPFSKLQKQFDVRDVTKAPAFFDVAKLRAFNGEYIRRLDVDSFVAACEPWVYPKKGYEPPWPPENFDPVTFRAVAPLAQTRITVLAENVNYVDFLFLSRPAMDDVAWGKTMKPGADDMLRCVAATLRAAQWNVEGLRAAVEAAAAEQGLKLGKAQAPLRVAITGRTVGLPLFESLQALGRERTLARIEDALAKLT